MKGWIELGILTHTEDSEKFEKLGIDTKDEDFKYKRNLVQISRISSIGLEPEEDGVIYIDASPVSTEETTEEIIKLIENDLNK